MSALQNNDLELDIFYKKDNLPEISLGDKVKLVVYLELPKEVGEGEKKEKNNKDQTSLNASIRLAILEGHHVRGLTELNGVFTWQISNRL